MSGLALPDDTSQVRIHYNVPKKKETFVEDTGEDSNIVVMHVKGILSNVPNDPFKANKEMRDNLRQNIAIQKTEPQMTPKIVVNVAKKNLPQISYEKRWADEQERMALAREKVTDMANAISSSVSSMSKRFELPMIIQGSFNAVVKLDSGYVPKGILENQLKLINKGEIDRLFGQYLKKLKVREISISLKIVILNALQNDRDISKENLETLIRNELNKFDFLSADSTAGLLNESEKYIQHFLQNKKGMAELFDVSWLQLKKDYSEIEKQKNDLKNLSNWIYDQLENGRTIDELKSELKKKIHNFDRKSTIKIKEGLNNIIYYLSDLKFLSLKDGKFNPKFNKQDVLNALNSSLDELKNKNKFVGIQREWRKEEKLLSETIDRVKKWDDKLIEKDKIPTWIRPKLMPYISGIEVMMALEDSRATLVVKNAAIATHQNEPALAIKLGFENKRESLARKVLSLFGLTEFLVPKVDIQLKGADLLDIEDPKVIVSQWIEGGKSFPLELRLKYIEKRRELACLRWKLKQDPLNSDLEQKVKDLKEEIYKKGGVVEQINQLGGQVSGLSHALTDALLWSYDSHMNQFILSNNEFYNIDFARFLSPNETVIFEDPKNPENNRTYVTLRSAFLDHPLAERTLPDEIIQSLLSIDMQKIEELLRKENLIGDKTEFKQAQTKVDACISAREILKRKKDLLEISDQLEQIESGGELLPELQGLCKKYNRPINDEQGEPLSVQQLKANWNEFSEKELHNYNKIINQNIKIINEKYDLKLDESTLEEYLGKTIDQLCQQCYSKIHPAAFEKQKQRISRLQDYLKTEKEPTLHGAMMKMNPDLEIFFQVVERLDGAPFECISVNPETGEPRSLEEIIDEADKKPLITPKEKEMMLEKLAKIRQNSPPMTSLRTAMDMFT